MSSYVNNHTVCGNVGREPERKELPNGNLIARFSLALTKNKTKPTTWIRVSCFGQAAEFALKYIHTGDSVLVIGETSLHEWEKDGVKKAEMQIEAGQVKLMHSKAKRESGGAQDNQYMPDFPPPSDDIPF